MTLQKAISKKKKSYFQEKIKKNSNNFRNYGYLDSSIAPDDDNLEISGYSLVRSDHPSNNKRGGVCVYYKNFLPLRVLDIQYLHECINFELKIGDKICNFVALYRSPSQTQDKFDLALQGCKH